MNYSELPLYNALIKHIGKKPISFHVPGHKYGTVFPFLETNVFNKLLSIDNTEIIGLDDLHSPTGVIAESQRLTAKFYNVMKSYYLVGGSTAGNLSAILAICQQGDTVLVQRNSHKSILNGLKLAKVKPVFLVPEYDVDGKISTNVSRETFCRAVEHFPNAKAVILTSPNYYGVVSNDLESIISTAHSLGILAIIDEAHGAHLKIGEPFPRSAIDFGADVIIQSAHKTLPAMTMGSFLHINSSLVDDEKIQYYLQVIQSSSPSYPIMASLELARYFLSSVSEEYKKTIIHDIIEFRRELSNIGGIKVLDDQGKDFKLDMLKLIIQSACNLNGFELQQRLENENIYTELADPFNVLLVLPLSRLENIELIISKVKKAVEGCSLNSVIYDSNSVSMNQDKVSTLALPFDKMNLYQTVKLQLKDAEGHIAAETITPYPPGIPILLPGERITKSHIDQIQLLRKAGARFQNNEEIWNEGVEIYSVE